MEFPLYHGIRGGPPLQDGPYYDNFLMSPKGWMRL